MFSKRQHSSIRHSFSKERRLRGLEVLETRLCLSGNSLVVNNDFDWGDLQIEDIASPGAILAAPPVAVANKINGLLWSALQDELTGSAQVAGLTSANPGLDVNPLTNGRAKVGTNGKVEVIVEVATWSPETVGVLDGIGLDIGIVNAELQVAQGWASPAEINALLVDASVSSVRLPDYGVTNSGVVDTEGDAIHRANDVREVFASRGIDGSGIRVGVISDGVDNRATVAVGGDLPASITVNPTLPGVGDEGTAMLEIVHDLAPGAQLFFSSGIGGSAEMIGSVNWLVSQGVDVIVDDLGFFGESYFEDGAIANAVRGAVNSGVSYFSAAGNQAQDHYQADYTPSGFQLTDPNDFETQEIHELRPGDLTLGVAIGANGGRLDATLQWSDPFGASNNDYNFYLVDNSTGQPIQGLLQTDQTGAQDPYESISVVNNGSANFIGSLVITRDVGAADRELELFVRNDLAQEFFVSDDGIIGHQAVTEINTVGAIDQADPGNDDVELFSNRGPSTIYTNFTTQASTTRNSLDGAAIDGVQTRAGQLGFFSNPFFGTSAAAPHAAAIAALLLSIDPTLTPAEVSTILADTAVDIGIAGYDANSGNGRFDAYAAATSILPPVITDVRLDGSGWTGLDAYSYASLASSGDQLKPIFTQGVDTLEIEFSEHVLFGQNGSELTLVGSGNVLLDSSDYTFTYDVASHTGTWTFTAPLPTSKYRLELSSSSVTDTGGNALDTEWTQPFGGTLDNFADDLSASFPSGNGIANGGGAFEFNFSLLAGDANQDGIVNAADASIAVDVNGDGVGNATDLGIIAGLQGNSLRARATRGDYLDDDYVDVNDYLTWKFTFGNSVTPGTGADGNGDGTVSLADFTIWRDNLGQHSAWTTATIGNLPAPIVIPGAGPQVADVVISGSQSQHAPYSYADEMSDPNWISGDQLRTVPVGGADTISITFSEDVNVGASDLTLHGLTTANRPVLDSFQYDVITMTATWSFTGWSFGDHYLLTLSDEVTDVEGDHLDGDWVNPLATSTTNTSVSQFPSGNGNSLGDFKFVMTLLPGDANLDAVVDITDFGILQNNYGNTLGQLFSDGDYDGDGDVDLNDFGSLSFNWGTNLQSLSILADTDGDFDVDQTDIDTMNANYNMVNPTKADGDLDGDGDIDIDDLDLAFEQFGLGLVAVA